MGRIVKTSDVASSWNAMAFLVALLLSIGDLSVADAAPYYHDGSSYPRHTATNQLPVTILPMSGRAVAVAITVMPTPLPLDFPPTGLDTNKLVWLPVTNRVTNLFMIDLGEKDGPRDVWVSFRYSKGEIISEGTTVHLNRTPIQFDLIAPTNLVVPYAMLQLKGRVAGMLELCNFDLVNDAGVFTNQDLYVSGTEFNRANPFDEETRTNFISGVDISLAPGTNRFEVHLGRMGGYQSTTNITIVYDPASLTNNPVITLEYPPIDELGGDEFMVTGWMDDATARITATITANGRLEKRRGMVGRDGNFIIERIPMLGQTNQLEILAENASGLTSRVTRQIVRAPYSLIMDTIPDEELGKFQITVTGTIDDTNYTVWVNARKAKVEPNGKWRITNLSFPPGNSFIGVVAIANTNNHGYGAVMHDPLPATNSYQADHDSFLAKALARTEAYRSNMLAAHPRPKSGTPSKTPDYKPGMMTLAMEHRGLIYGTGSVCIVLILLLYGRYKPRKALRPKSESPDPTHPEG